MNTRLNTAVTANNTVPTTRSTKFFYELGQRLEFIQRVRLMHLKQLTYAVPHGIFFDMYVMRNSISDVGCHYVTEIVLRLLEL
jgi:hypothetical protein